MGVYQHESPNTAASLLESVRCGDECWYQPIKCGKQCHLHFYHTRTQINHLLSLMTTDCSQFYYTEIKDFMRSFIIITSTLLFIKGTSHTTELTFCCNRENQHVHMCCVCLWLPFGYWRIMNNWSALYEGMRMVNVFGCITCYEQVNFVIWRLVNVSGYLMHVAWLA